MLKVKVIFDFCVKFLFVFIIFFLKFWNKGKRYYKEFKVYLVEEKFFFKYLLVSKIEGYIF